MAKVIANVAISLDGFVAGPRQSLENPIGEGGMKLHRWQFEEPEKNAEARARILSPSAVIMGRHMFGHDRGEWDLSWKGWWGEEPPYHSPVFVLGHRPRDPLPMQGGTTFYFVTEGIEAAMKMAQDAAGDGLVGIAGGASTLRQYLKAGMVDELGLHVAPVVLGAGEALFEGLAGLQLEPLEIAGTALVTHIYYRVVK